MPFQWSPSSRRVRPFLVMEILERAQDLERTGADIVHLELGEPDFKAPPAVARAAEDAVRDGRTRYTHSLGIRELREEISRWYRRRHGIEVSPERVVVTTGTSGGLSLLMALLLGPGDEILMSDPGYACYPNFVLSFGGEPRRFPLRPEDGYRYRIDAVRAAIGPRTRAIIVNSPANPTAVVQDADVLREIAALGVPIVSDEIYHGLEYGTRARTILEFAPDAFVLDGFSKRYAMTGWRIGWLVAPESAVDTIQKLQQNLFICAGSVAQHAALAALREADADVEAMRREYEGRRGVLIAGLRRLGFPARDEPGGAYYIFADSRRLGADSLALARRILEEAHVGVAPGIDFGPGGEGHLRFSFSPSRERIEEGLRRLERWV